jgi:tetrathionate reductase subunit B
MRVKIRKRYAMAVDTKRCVGCNGCVLSCNAENSVPDEGSRCWIETKTTGSYPNLAMEIFSSRCMHCSDAPCVTNCPTGASHQCTGGTVMVDKSLCTGCKACIASCPYDARYVHSAGYVDKCTFCLHRVEKGLQPACASNCPTNALTFGDLLEPSSEVAKLLRSRRYKTLRSEKGTDPNVYFLL